jgi:ribosomal protein S18 acetylase RimI-like enzyme
VSHILDRPAWNSLLSGWAQLAEGDGAALRLRPDHGPFGGARPGGSAALLPLIPVGGTLWLVERHAPEVPDGAAVVKQAALIEMLAETLRPRQAGVDAQELGAADAAEMQALAALCKPGPFCTHTHRLGRFVGVRQAGRLIAMAGERMRVPGYTEVSGVCTHPDHQGRGLAGALISVVAEAMVARGETPFLHCYPENRKAIALYESLGFRFRATIGLTIIARAQASESLR